MLRFTALKHGCDTSYSCLSCRLSAFGLASHLAEGGIVAKANFWSATLILLVFISVALLGGHNPPSLPGRTEVEDWV